MKQLIILTNKPKKTVELDTDKILVRFVDPCLNLNLSYVTNDLSGLLNLLAGNQNGTVVCVSQVTRSWLALSVLFLRTSEFTHSK